MNYLLDTNVVSELRKLDSGRCDPGVAAWAHRADRTQQYLSVATIRELWSGALLIARRDQFQGQRLANWVGEITQEFRHRL
ncbi:MAG: hypothetical protein LBG60_09585, partial [Bifidobacteriaceae bacterium]|nr:hypothetical protein [Bifidobacteriaceae bacterium]